MQTLVTWFVKSRQLIKTSQKTVMYTYSCYIYIQLFMMNVYIQNCYLRCFNTGPFQKSISMYWLLSITLFLQRYILSFRSYKMSVIYYSFIILSFYNISPIYLIQILYKRNNNWLELRGLNIIFKFILINFILLPLFIIKHKI